MDLNGIANVKYRQIDIKTFYDLENGVKVTKT